MMAPMRAAADPASEFRELVDVLLDFLARHPEAGPKAAAIDLPTRFVAPDLKLLLHVAPAGPKARAKGVHLEWSWGPAPKGFKAKALVTCPSALVPRLALGKENPARAIDRGDVTLTPLDPSVESGRLLDLLPVLVPLRGEVSARLREAGLGRFAS